MVDGCDRWPFLFFFFSDFRIVSESHFACNWQSMFWDSESIVTHFLSNKCMEFGHTNPTQLYRVALRPMSVCCMLCAWVGSEPYDKTLILLVELTNQKRDIYRHRILYPLQHGPPFPNDGKILKLIVGLGPD